MNDLKKTIVIEFSRPTVYQLPRVPSSRPEESAGLLLLQGENTVTESYWEGCKRNPGVKAAIAAGWVKRGRDGVANPIPKDFDDLPPKRVEAVVEKIEDVEKLTELKVKAKKKATRDIVSKKIEQVMELNKEKA